MHENNAPMPYLNAESMAKLYAGQIAVTLDVNLRDLREAMNF